MIIVSDTSPVSNLFVLDRLELLRDLYDTIVIPQAVLDELLKLEGFGYPIRQILKLNWIQIQKPQNQQEVQQLRQSLDAGESEAIALAIEMNADLLLIDERAGAQMAKRLGLKTIGLLGILVKAKEARLIKELKPVLQELETQAGFWLSEKLKNEVLTSVDE